MFIIAKKSQPDPVLRRLYLGLGLLLLAFVVMAIRG